MPIRANRPAPHCSAKRNFFNPSMKNTPPARNRIRMTARGAFVRIIRSKSESPAMPGLS